MNLEKISLRDNTTQGDRLFRIEIEGWKCALGFCLDKEKEEEKDLYVIIDTEIPERMKSIVLEAVMKEINYSDYSSYSVKFYYDFDFKTTNLNNE